MLVVTTGAILMTSIDRAILPTVLPGILTEFNLGETVGGFLVGLSFAGTMTGGLLLGVGLGASGFLAASVAAYIIENFGFTVHYVVIAMICLLALIPIAMIRETATMAGER
jgi:hypothetical protein